MPARTTKKKVRKKQPVVINDNGYFTSFMNERFKNQELVIKSVRKDIPNIVREAVKSEYLGCNTRIDWEGNGNDNEPSYKEKIDDFLDSKALHKENIVISKKQIMALITAVLGTGVVGMLINYAVACGAISFP